MGSQRLDVRPHPRLAGLLAWVAIMLAPLAWAQHAKPGQPSTPKTLARPKLIVLLVVDQMRGDYVDKFRGQWSGGLQRMLEEGAWFRDAAYPYAVIATGDGRRAYCSLWNASQVAALDLESGRVTRRTPLLPPASPIAPGSHPTAMLLSPDEKLLYVALANRDRVAVIDTSSGKVVAYLSTRLPGQVYGGSVPVALAQTQDGRRLFVANSAANTVAVFDRERWRTLGPGAAPMPKQPGHLIARLCPFSRPHT